MPGLANMYREEYDDQRNDSSRDTCFSCGKFGHWARDCPDADDRDGYFNRRRGGYQGRGFGRGRGRGGYSTVYSFRSRTTDACYKCGQLGHFARECENENDFNDRRTYRRTDYCYRCGLAGHIARDCTSNQNTCYNCHKEGHLARDCPENNECYRCGKPGHFARQCPENEERSVGGRPNRRDIGTKECYICRSTDHIQAKCPEAVCYRCHKEGHIARDCPTNEECYNCGRPGHVARDCIELRCGVTEDDDGEDVYLARNGGEFNENNDKEEEGDDTNA